MKQFFSLGPSTLDVGFINPVDNNSYNIKPVGGIWATTYHPEYPDYNEWVEFLTRNLQVLFYKYPSANPFKKNGIILNIREDANIFYLRTYQDFLDLQSSYPHKNGYFDYRAMEEDFDGIYVDLAGIHKDKNFSLEQHEYFEAFGVSSLVLFNYNPVISYQRALVEIEPFDYEDSNCYVSYKIKVNSNIIKLERNRVLKRS